MMNSLLLSDSYIWFLVAMVYFINLHFVLPWKLFSIERNRLNIWNQRIETDYNYGITPVIMIKTKMIKFQNTDLCYDLCA